MSRIATVTEAPSRIRAYETMIRSRGAELAAAVTAIAEEEGPAPMADDDQSRLTIALTLLAAGLSIEVVATPDAALRRALDVLHEYNGVEFYLLRNGVAVEHFHALRERLGTAFSAA